MTFMRRHLRHACAAATVGAALCLAAPATAAVAAPAGAPSSIPAVSGLAPTGNTFKALIEHWDGTSWS